MLIGNSEYNNLIMLDKRSLYKNTSLSSEVLKALREKNFEQIFNKEDFSRDETLTYDVIQTVLNFGISLGYSFFAMSNPNASNFVNSVIGFVSSLYFNYKSADSSTPSSLWNQIRVFAESMMDSKIDEQHFNDLVSHIKGLGNILDDYLYYRNRGYTGVDRAYLYCLQGIDHCRVSMPHFQQEKSAAITLPLFAQFANLHLLLYKDLIESVKIWGISEEEHEKDKQRFQFLIKEYSKYASDTYQAGLKQWAENKQPDYNYPTVISDNSKKHYQSTGRWNHINEFDRRMQLSVTNIVSLFPLYYSVDYPTPVSIKQSHKIYSDIHGLAYTKVVNNSDELYGEFAIDKSNGTLMKIEGEGVLGDIYQGGYNPGKDGIWKIMNSSDNGNGEVDILPPDGMKPTIPNIYKDEILSDNIAPITKIKVISNLIPYRCEFIRDVPSKSSIIGNFPPKYKDTGLEQIKPKDISYSGYKLTEVRFLKLEESKVALSALPLQDYAVSGGIVFGFNKIDTSHKHIISPHHITQIPAEMYTRKLQFYKSPEYINGQDSMACNAVNAKGAFLEYKIYIPEELPEYTIRIRAVYDTVKNGNLDFELYDGNSFNGIGSIDLGRPNKDTLIIPGRNNNKYALFTMQQLGSKQPFKIGENIIRIKSTESTDIFIDRLEFQPNIIEKTIGNDKVNITFMFIDNRLYTTSNGTAGSIGTDKNKEWTVVVDGREVYSFIETKLVSEVIQDINSKKIIGQTFFVTDKNRRIQWHDDTGGKLYICRRDSYYYALVGENINGEQPLSIDNKKYYVYCDGVVVYTFQSNDKINTIVSGINALSLKGNDIAITENPTLLRHAQNAVWGLFTSLTIPYRIGMNITEYDIRAAEHLVDYLETSEKGNLPLYIERARECLRKGERE